jgi:hypothetical protein
MRQRTFIPLIIARLLLQLTHRTESTSPTNENIGTIFDQNFKICLTCTNETTFFIIINKNNFVRSTSLICVS